MAGTVAVVTGIAGPIGQAVARRLASECQRLVFSDPDPRAARSVLAEVERIRTLHGFDTEPVFVAADAATDEGARVIVCTALNTFGRVDSVIINGALTVSNGDGDGALSISLDAFVPAVRMGGSALKRQGEGSIVLTALMGGTWPGELGAAARETAVSSFTAFVHAAARALHEGSLSLNGVALEDPASADRTLDIAAPFSSATVRGDRQRRSHQLHDAGYATRFLASSEARGLNGQVFVLSGNGPVGAPPYAAPAEAAAYTELFQHIEPLRA
jgi:NAD(P)-dependent dehydrogenase (short-subunit alcohol dehydrogenase family)